MVRPHTHTRCVNFLRVPFRCLSRTLELKCSFIFLYLSICFVWHRTQGDFSSRSQERGGGILWEVRDWVRIFGIIYAVTWYLCTFGNVFYLTVDLLSAPRSRASLFFWICWTFPFLFLFSVMPLRRLSIIVSLFFFLFLGSNCPFWLEEKPKTDPPYIRVKHTHAGVYDIFSKCWAVGNFKRWETWFHSAFSFHT